MDLIRRDDAFAALGEMPENWTDSPEEIEAVNSWCYAVEAINSVPSVDAVPLDKLCEWLAGYAEPPMDALTICDNPFEAWKMTLTNWMEEQDAKEET